MVIFCFFCNSSLPMQRIGYKARFYFAHKVQQPIMLVKVTFVSAIETANNKRLLNSAFVSSKELSRSRRVLSAEAVKPSSISIILQMILSLIQ